MKKQLLLALGLMISVITQAQTEECINFSAVNDPVDDAALDYTQGKINIKTNIGTFWGKQANSSLFFYGWFNVDVSNETSVNKKLTISNPGNNYIAIDGDTIALIGIIPFPLGKKYSFSFESGRIIVKGDFNKVSLGNSSASIDHVCLTTEPGVTLNVLDQEVKSIKIGPNPSSGIVNINLNYSELKVYSSSGNLVFTTQNQQSSINLSFLPKGHYYVRIISQNGIVNQTIILK